MDPRKDYYATLGVSSRASFDQIKKAYRKLVMRHHPDRNPGNATSVEILQALNEAYGVLRDAPVRKDYDRMREERARRPAPKPAPRPNPPPAYTPRSRRPTPVAPPKDQPFWWDYRVNALVLAGAVSIAMGIVYIFPLAPDRVTVPSESSTIPSPNPATTLPSITPSPWLCAPLLRNCRHYLPPLTPPPYYASHWDCTRPGSDAGVAVIENGDGTYNVCLCRYCIHL